MENTNCLEGMRCPNCKSPGPFNIWGKAYFHVHDDGCSEFEELCWEENSNAHCPGCDWNGKVREMRVWDAERVVSAIWDVLYREDDGRINPDKEWNADTLDAIAEAVHRCTVRPRSTIKELDGRYTCTACGYEWAASMGDNEVPAVCPCQGGGDHQ